MLNILSWLPLLIFLVLSNSGVPAVFAMWTLDCFFAAAAFIAYFVDIPRGILARDKSLHKRRWVNREHSSAAMNSTAKNNAKDSALPAADIEMT